MRARAREEAERRFQELYVSERSAAWIYARSIVGDAATAEDVTAASFEKLWKKRERLSELGGSARAYLMRSIRNTAIDELRRRSRHATPFESVEELIGAGGSPAVADPSEKLAAEELARELLGGLDPDSRELVVLRYWLDLSNAEIAGLTGLSESNVGTKLSRILKRLRCDEKLEGSVR